MKSVKNKIVLSTLFENTATCMDVMAAWGFSVLIETNSDTFLFDTGGVSDCCVYNAASLKKDLSKVKKIILSHGHLDHVGGIYSVAHSINDPFARDVKKLI